MCPSKKKKNHKLEQGGGYHLVRGGLSLPEPGTRALAAGAGRHLGRDRENCLQITDAVGVDGEDGEVFWLHIVGVALVGNRETASKDLVGIDGVSSVERTNCDIPVSLQAPRETRVAVSVDIPSVGHALLPSPWFP